MARVHRGVKRQMIPDEVRARLLLWCARHCCFCGKPCRMNIEIHHIDGDKTNNDTDNLVPLCFDCHGELSRSGVMGLRYRSLEIKTRRDQIYEVHTRPYLRQVNITISNSMHHVRNQRRRWGDVSCTVQLMSQDLPIQLRLKIVRYQNGGVLKSSLDDLYSGGTLWNLNPGQIVYGHFDLPIAKRSKPFICRAEIFGTIVDVLQREHPLLPFSYVWNGPAGDWWYDPRTIYSQS
jgi:hypothetical protein